MGYQPHVSSTGIIMLRVTLLMAVQIMYKRFTNKRQHLPPSQRVFRKADGSAGMVSWGTLGGIDMWQVCVYFVCEKPIGAAIPTTVPRYM
jgi:hypothetical protein